MTSFYTGIYKWVHSDDKRQSFYGSHSLIARYPSKAIVPYLLVGLKFLTKFIAQILSKNVF